MKIFLIITLALISFSLTAGCNQGGSAQSEVGSASSQFPGTMDGAKSLLQQFIQPNADRLALSQKLRPTQKDYKAVFKGDVAKKVEEAYGEPWNAGKIVLGGEPAQTELLIWSATTKDLQSNTGSAGQFPGGYAKAAPHFKDGVTFYRFKFVEPGKPIGFAWDGLVFVNGRWVIFPKPWRALR